MSDKKKVVADISQETDKQFLDRTGVGHQLKDVLAKIVENRPEDPIEFLADYFETLGEKSNRVAKAHQQICLTHHSKPAFSTNIRTAYDILTHNKVSRHMKGVNGVVYNELLHLLCKEFPPSLTEKLLKKIRLREHEAVVYDVFRSGVFTCLVLKDFINQAVSLYRCLDSQDNGKADRALCENISKHLVTTVSTVDDSPNSVLEASYKLGPDKVHETISKALLKPLVPKGATTSQEDFIILISDAFLSKVKTLR